MVSLLLHDVFVADPAESGFCSPAADRYKLSRDEFAAQLVRLRGGAASARQVRLRGDAASARQVRLRGGAAPFRLTFDDAGISYYTVIAEMLETHGWRGYCFVPSDFMGAAGFMNGVQLRELDARGHTIGSHSASHPTRFTALSGAQMREEWSKSRRALEDVLGRAVTVASIPGGYFSRTVAQAAADSGVQLLFTSEPVSRLHVVDGCTVAGRFTIRRGAPPDRCRKLVEPPPWTRYRAWTNWNAKALAKPLLGSSYPRVAEWIHSRIPSPVSRVCWRQR